MSSSTPHIVCVACGAANRTPAGQPALAARCGRCSQPLFTAAPQELPPGRLDRMLAADTGRFVLDVWADWCGPCRMMAPAFAEAARAFAGQVRFLKLDSEADQAAAAALGVRSIPALFAFSGGVRTGAEVGALSAPAIMRWTRASFPDLANPPS